MVNCLFGALMNIQMIVQGLFPTELSWNWNPIEIRDGDGAPFRGRHARFDDPGIFQPHPEFPDIGGVSFYQKTYTVLPPLSWLSVRVLCYLTFCCKKTSLLSGWVTAISCQRIGPTHLWNSAKDPSLQNPSAPLNATIYWFWIRVKIPGKAKKKIDWSPSFSLPSLPMNADGDCVTQTGDPD